jgi:hypothetical protein
VVREQQRQARVELKRARKEAHELRDGVDIRPTIAVTRARLQLAEIGEAIASGRLKVDGQIVHESGDVAVTKAGKKRTIRCKSKSDAEKKAAEWCTPRRRKTKGETK